MSLFYLTGHKAFALTSTDFQVPPASYTWLSPTEIDATLGDGSTVSFVNNNPINHVFTPTTNQFPNFMFCSGTNITAALGLSPTATINARWIENPLPGQNCNTVALRIFTFQGTVAVTNPNAGTNNSSDACFANSNGFGFAWAVCPLLAAAGSLANTLVAQFEGQLSFSVQQLGDPNAVNCGPNSTGNNCGASKIHQSWALIRDISTALVVVVMLIMVFSQAASFGPFDAYTVRKLLPKLVAAVILIQISWFGAVWIVDLVNAIGRGIADLMYYPFGGSSKMDLFSLLGNAHLGGTSLGVLDFAAITVGVALGVAFLFTMLGVAFVAIAALFFAVLTLIFRKILIIIMLIFVPLALLAWILPGTERYWKLWRDNFIKVLFMFPIVMAIIAAGRIFAYVVGSQDNSEFLNLLFILVGFFGPLFILPKTFKWGGQAMSMAGGAIMKAGSKVSERPKKLFDSRQEAYSGLRRGRSQKRFAENVGFNWRKPKSYYQRPLDLVRSGKWDPTLQGEMSKRAQDAYVHAGEEAENKEVEAARSRLLRQGQAIRARGGNWDRFFQMAGEGEPEYEDETLGTIQIGKLTETEQDAARKQTAILGSATNWRYLEELHQRSTEKDDYGNYKMSEKERVRTRKFFDDNVDKIMPKMPHFYQGYAATAETSGPALAGLHAVEAEAVLGHFSQEVSKYDAEATRATSPEARAMALGKRDAAQKSLVTFAQNIREAAKNPNITLDNGMLRAAKGFLDPTDGQGFRTSINDDPHPVTGAPRADGRATRHLPELKSYTEVAGLTPEAQATMRDIANELAPKIDKTTGSIDRDIGGGISRQSPQPRSAGTFPAPGSTNWSPSAGTNTRIGPEEGETNIPHDE